MIKAINITPNFFFIFTTNSFNSLISSIITKLMKEILGCLKYIHCSDSMESKDFTPPHVEEPPSRPSLGFPLGIALLLIIIFSLSGIFSCYYHWDKLRSLRRARSFSDDPLQADSQEDASAVKLALIMVKEKQHDESLTVLMPGDRVPKFIAMPCPRQPHVARVEKINVLLKKPGPGPGRAPPFIPVPFYL